MEISSAKNISPSNQLPPTRQFQETQDNVDEVVGIMRINIDKVLEREEKLSDLNERADNLQEGALRFEKTATQLKNKNWWNNMKLMVIIGVISIILLIIIIVMIVW